MSCFIEFEKKKILTDPVSGIVTTKARLDRETKSMYTVVLVARDQGSPSQQATRILEVVVKDIDDHPPQFIRTPYDGPLQFSVLEEVGAAWEVDTLKAVDPDEGENALVEYLITCRAISECVARHHVLLFT